jgi:hypothetical protein
MKTDVDMDIGKGMDIDIDSSMNMDIDMDMVMDPDMDRYEHTKWTSIGPTHKSVILRNFVVFAQYNDSVVTSFYNITKPRAPVVTKLKLVA